MKKIIKIGVVMLLVIAVSGCTSSYNDCKNDCYWRFNDNYKFKYNSTCDDRTFFSNILGETEPIYVPCLKIDYDEVKMYCFNECKGVK